MSKVGDYLESWDTMKLDFKEISNSLPLVNDN